MGPGPSLACTKCPPWPQRPGPHPPRACAGRQSEWSPLSLQLKVPRPLPSFPHATSQTLLAKFKQQHEDNRYFLGTPVMEPAFIIQHFAGKVKYQIKVRVCPLPSSVKGGGRKGAGCMPRRPLTSGVCSAYPLY